MPTPLSLMDRVPAAASGLSVTERESEPNRSTAWRRAPRSTSTCRRHPRRWKSDSAQEEVPYSAGNTSSGSPIAILSAWFRQELFDLRLCFGRHGLTIWLFLSGNSEPCQDDHLAQGVVGPPSAPFLQDTSLRSGPQNSRWRKPAPMQRFGRRWRAICWVAASKFVAAAISEISGHAERRPVHSLKSTPSMNYCCSTESRAPRGHPITCTPWAMPASSTSGASSSHC